MELREVWTDAQAMCRTFEAGHASRVTRYPMSIWKMTISIMSSPISLARIPYRYPG